MARQARKPALINPTPLPAFSMDDVPPHDPAAEADLLASILLEPHRLPDVRAILPHPAAFYDSRNQALYATILRLADRQAVPDATIVAREVPAELEGYTVAIVERQFCGVNALYFARHVADKAARRQAIRDGYDLAKRAATGEEIPSTPLPALFHLSDLGNARRLVHRHGQDLRYVQEDARWLAWDGVRFRLDGAHAEQLARTLPDLIRAEADTLPEQDAQAAYQWAAKSESRSRLVSALALAQAEPAVVIRRDALDRDPDLLAAPNGLVDLRTGTLRASDRTALCTRLAGIAYDPAATAPAWDDFLDRTFASDADLIGYVQRVAGYSLTGRTTEQVALFLYGTGANGKSTWLRALQAVAGEYAIQADFATFSTSQVNPNHFGLARLAGARLVTCSEARPGEPVDEVVLKQVTGGDRVAARAPYGDFFEFDPRFKLLVACNHEPTVRSQDEGTWRRLRVIPFLRTIPADERRGTFFEEVILPELPGILAWAVRGAVSWYQVGLGTAGLVSERTAEYREDQDVLGLFIADCCILGPQFAVQTSDLYVAYSAWAESQGDRPWSHRHFSLRLRERDGIRPERETSAIRRRIWRGIGLRAPSYSSSPG